MFHYGPVHFHGPIHYQIGYRVVFPEEPCVGGLDEMIAHPFSDVPMVRLGSGGSVKVRLRDYDWRQHLQEAHAIDQQNNGTIDYFRLGLPWIAQKLNYNGMVNSFNWPLNHHRLDIVRENYTFREVANELVSNRFKWQAWASEYVTDKFAEVIAERFVPRTRDIVGSHDHHLYRLGHHLLKRGVDAPLAFFLHTPVPTYASYSNLQPQQQAYLRDALTSLFAYNHIGVQSSRDLLNLWDLIAHNERPQNPALYTPYKMDRRIGNVTLSTYVSILPAVGHNRLYEGQAIDPQNVAEAEKYLRDKGFKKPPNIFTWGRLDYSKGGVNLLKGIRYAIEELGVPPGEIRFLHQAAHGSRAEIKAFQREHDELQRLHKKLMDDYGGEGEGRGLQVHFDTKTLERPIALAIARKVGKEGGICIFPSLADGYGLVINECYSAQDPQEPCSMVIGKSMGAGPVVDGGAYQVDAVSWVEIGETIARIWKDKNNDKGKRDRQTRYGIGINNINEYTNSQWQAKLLNVAAEEYHRSLLLNRPRYSSVILGL